MLPRAATLFVLAVHFLLPQPASAQTLRGTIRDRVTALPIRGAFLELLDTAGSRVSGTLSDSSGHFRFDVVPGRYGLRAQAIGYADERQSPGDLAAGEERALAISLPPSPVRLPALSVEAAPRCRLKADTSGAVALAWAEARRSLNLAMWSMSESGLSMVARTEGSVRQAGFRQEHEVVQDTVTGRPPYLTVALDSVRDRGLFQPGQERTWFFAPGPDYILSDDFLKAHCFSLRRSRSGIALDFLPTLAGGEGEIRGTLWLDGRTRQLKRIDFRFNDTRHPVDVRGADGTLKFQRSPEGYLLINEWEVRVPVYRGASQIYRKDRHGKIVTFWSAPR